MAGGPPQWSRSEQTYYASIASTVCQTVRQAHLRFRNEELRMKQNEERAYAHKHAWSDLETSGLNMFAVCNPHGYNRSSQFPAHKPGIFCSQLLSQWGKLRLLNLSVVATSHFDISEFRKPQRRSIRAPSPKRRINYLIPARPINRPLSTNQSIRDAKSKMLRSKS